MLTKKQELFCRYYLGECAGNATEAAIKAGYSRNSAAKNTTQILNSKEVQRYLKEIKEEIKKSYAQQTAETTKYKISNVAEIQEFWSKIMNDERQETRDRLRASELLAKCNGMFSDWN